MTGSERSVFSEEFVKDPKLVTPGDRIVQLFENDRFDIYVVMRSGRVFKRRARGQSGSYDNWQEVDLVREINEDLKRI